MIRKLSQLLLLTVGAAIAHSACAIPVVVDFTVTATTGFDGNNNFFASTYNGYNTGATGNGSFVFDDSIGTFHDENAGRSVRDLQFSWLGETWTETSALLFSLTFDANGGLSAWSLGANPQQPGDPGLAWISSHGPTDFWLVTFPASSAQGNVAGLHSSSAVGWMNGSIAWSVRPTSVPEPASLGMFAAGLFGLRLARKRRR